MTFRETLDEHLRAIANRDLQALAATLPTDELTLITSDGRLVRSVHEFLQLHRSWFESETWSLQADPVHVYETPDIGVAVMHLDYRDEPTGATAIQETSYLTLIFARQGNRWVMVQDQNTPVKKV